MDIATLIDNHKDKEIVLNFPSSLGGQFDKEKEYIAKIIKGLSIDIRMFYPIDRRTPCLIHLRDYLIALKGILPVENVTVIKNGFFGKTEDYFDRWKNSSLRKKFKTAGGKEIFIAELSESVIDEINYAMPFSTAIKDSTLSFVSRIQLERWLKETTLLLCPEAS